MKKKLKIYLHHSHFEPVSYKIGFFKSALNAVGHVCYIVGLAVINIVTLPWKIFRSIPDMKRVRTVNFQKTAAVFAVLAILVGSTVHGLNLIAAGQTIKGQVLGASTSGLDYLHDAQTSLENQDAAAAQVNLGKALEQFKNSQQTLNSTDITLKGLLAVVPQKQDADRLLEAAQKITEAGIKGTELLKLTDGLKLSAAGLSGDGNNHDVLIQIQTILNETVALADEAASLVSQVSVSSLPKNYQQAFLAARDTASIFQENAATLKSASSLIFDILLGSKNVLLVFQNNNELRASGGFMGTIGRARMTDGSIDSLDIRSVYDLDGQLKEKIMPPQPLLAVNDRWFLRDSNWFASFPESASRITGFYEKEGGETPDLIITMTPDVILDMLDKTGPITIPQSGITLSKDNFVEITQEETSVNYDKEVNQPKQFLADFFPLLMEKLGSSENGGAMSFVEIFQRNLFRKQILLYSRNAEIEQKISAFNWGGELKQTDRDYLSVVNSNLGGTKTDRFIQRSIDLKSDISADGSVTDSLTLTIKNPLPQTDGLDNKSFVRVYVPQNSHLISSTGLINISLPLLNEDGYTIDEKVKDWQKDLTQDVSSGIYTGTESGKTWFGSWVQVQGGETKTVTLTYTLPYRLGSVDRNSLLIQKQPGSQTGAINYEVAFNGRSSMWKSNAAQSNGTNLTYSQDLISDAFIGLVLKKN
jgi:Protein of unknown function (DUF4012)